MPRDVITEVEAANRTLDDALRASGFGENKAVAKALVGIGHSLNALALALADRS